MKQSNIILDFEKGILVHRGTTEKIHISDNSEMLNEKDLQNNNIRNDNKNYNSEGKTSEGSITDKIEEMRKQVINEIESMHSNIDTNLLFRTDVKAEIRTIVETPIWSKQYPYPLSVNAFVNKEVKKMLDNGVIRPSKSPYNSPIWVVTKKGINEDGTPKLRMVIDYKKINEQTVSDRYPIPDTNVILSNLGKSKFFSTIDLESGFHQIKMKGTDIEKTSFSVNNGKYEFLRMPFGLKNAPSIFQRSMDDILRKHIGKICHVYIDDILVFSESLEEHKNNLNTIIETLKNANMKISLEKSKFYQTEVEFLGYIVAYNIIKTDPKKIETISNFPVPTTLRQLRSFLGMTGYYRKFMQNYASIAKPLTKHLSGENGRISQHMSKKTEVKLDQEGILACKQLKDLLINQIELIQPDFNKKFVLTTDASNNAIGGVLTQEGKPITFISKTLNSTEQNYATNEKELYAIVWALKNLRNYLYGVSNLEIHTDHQPLTFAVSTRNPNAKMKRWHAFIEEFAPKMVYKPGTTNVVADALSRQFLNNLSDSTTISGTQHSAESSDNVQIQETKKPLNQFKQQILLSKAEFTIHEQVKNFDKTRHIIEYDNLENLVTILKELLQPGIVAIYCTPEDLYEVKQKLKETFSNRFLYTKIFAIDITNQEDQNIIVEQTHVRAHRNYKENVKQIYISYYWPEMNKQFKEYIRNCEICNKNKYDRHPQKAPIGEAPIPKKEGEQIHIDIFFAEKLKFITCIDSYSKFLIIKLIEDKTKLDEKILEVLQSFPEVKKITVDNEPGFAAAQFKTLMNRLNIQIYFCNPKHSTTNGQVERVHSTLTEIARCLKQEFHLISDLESIYRAAQQYNKTIHSVINKRPYEVLFNKIQHDDLQRNLILAQSNMLKRNNENRLVKTYKDNDIIYEKNVGNRNKLQSKYKKQKVKEDLGNKVRIYKNNRLVHKDNIKK